MIDLSLILSGSEKLLNSLSGAESTRYNGLYTLQNVIEDRMRSRLWRYLCDVEDNNWESVVGQESEPRSKISWDSDTVIEELHEIFNSATPRINQLFPGEQKNFWGISIWRDSAGYKIGWHTDNPDIDVALQLYLYTEPGLGTVFGSEQDMLLIPSVENSGYLLLQNKDNKISHRTENAVPSGVVRYNLYAVWSRFPKHVADT